MFVYFIGQITSKKVSQLGLKVIIISDSATSNMIFLAVLRS